MKANRAREFQITYNIFITTSSKSEKLLFLYFFCQQIFFSQKLHFFTQTLLNRININIFKFRYVNLQLQPCRLNDSFLDSNLTQRLQSALNWIRIARTVLHFFNICLIIVATIIIALPFLSSQKDGHKSFFLSCNCDFPPSGKRNFPFWLPAHFYVDGTRCSVFHECFRFRFYCWLWVLQ